MPTSCHHLFHCNNTVEENITLPSFSSSLQHHHKRRKQQCVVIFFFSNIEKTKHTKKQQKNTKRRKELTFKFPLYPFTFGSRFCTPTFALPFQVFSLGIFFFSSEEKKHTHTQRRKNHREEKICK
jgi:hypothetical protein